MDIKTPVATWVLARLYNEEKPIQRKNLMKYLCNASFDSMTGEKDFGNTLKQLIDAKYIENTTEEYADFLDVLENPNAPEEEQTTRLQEVKRKREGFVITESGIYVFRKQIGTPLEKIQTYIDKIPSVTTNKFKKIVDALKLASDIISTAVKLCVDNAPLVLEFIQKVAYELRSVGINL